jgi:aspartyl-tRNA synthetase
MEIEPLRYWRRTHFSSEITPELDEKEVILFGWVRDVRDLGGIRFIILQDREGTVQITIPRKGVNKDIMRKVDALQDQYSIGVKGLVKRTKLTPRGIEVIPSEIRIFAVSKHPLPLDVTGRVPAEIDVRLDSRILDLCRDESRAIFRIRHVVLGAIRAFLSGQGFLEVHTPRIIASATEGGAALFSQSPQLYKEQLVLGFEKVFEIGSFFRAEKSHTRHHISEFISVDIEQAFATAEDVMNVLERLVHYVCKTVREKCQKELKILNYNVAVPETPFKRFTYDEVINELKEENVHIPWGEDISTRALRKLGKLHPDYYFITGWPTESKPFYIKPREDNPKVSEGFDLMWKWIELASGGTRVHSKEFLIRRLKEQGLNPESFRYHLKAFNYGMPPHAGWAIGLERLIMGLTGKKNIREVVLFPRDRFRLIP